MLEMYYRKVETMKLHLLHGPGVTSSRSKLQYIKRGFDPNSIVVFGAESSPDRVAGSLLTSPLFSQDMLIIWENPPEDCAIDAALTDRLSLVLWFDSELKPKSPALEFVKKNNGEIFFFGEAKEVSAFGFLDCLGSRDGKAFLELQKLKSARYDFFYALAMVYYLLRSLVCLPVNTPEFVRKKTAKQRLNFTANDLRELYRGILEIEFGLKTGLLDIPQAEFLLVNFFTG